MSEGMADIVPQVQEDGLPGHETELTAKPEWRP
jgi:hypothetical protein